MSVWAILIVHEVMNHKCIWDGTHEFQCVWKCDVLFAFLYYQFIVVSLIYAFEKVMIWYKCCVYEYDN